MRVTEILKADHQQVSHLFDQLERTQDAEGRQRLLDELAEELEVHAMAEEKVFYPAVRRINRERVEHANEEHSKVKTLIADVEGRNPVSADFAAKLRELKEAVLHHVREEESAIFGDAEQLGHDELVRLGREFAEQKEHLKTSLIQRGIRAAKQAARKIA